MNEYLIVVNSFIAGLGLMIGCLLYSLGGRRHIWLRRWIGTAVIAGTLMVASMLMKNFSIWLLLLWPMLGIGMSIGYGANNIIQVFYRRFFYISAIVIPSGLLMYFIYGEKSTYCLLLHLILGFLSLLLSIRSVIHAAAEEFFICLLMTMGLFMFPFIV